MGIQLKIKPLSLTKMKNAEYVTYMTRFRELIFSAQQQDGEMQNAIVDELPDFFMKQKEVFDADLMLLSSLLNHSRTYPESKALQLIDTVRNKQFVLIRNIVTTMRNSAVPDKRIAARALFRVIKAYRGVHRLPRPIKTAKLEALLLSLSEFGNPERIATLLLSDAVETLRNANEQYQKVLQQRVDRKQLTATEDSATIRLRLDKVYHEMEELLYARSIVTPSPALTTLLERLNVIIDETRTSYKQRLAALKRDGKTEKA